MILPGFPRMMTMGGGGFDPLTPLGTFIEGGYYLGQINDGGDLYALIVSPKSVEATRPIRTPGGGTGATGATSNTNGLFNTNWMFDLGSSYEAAQYCVGLSTNGKMDWYIPAKDELAQIYINRASLPSGQTFITSPGYFYWASTDDPSFPGYVYGQDFSSGAANAYAVGASSYIRPIRRVVMA